MARYGNEFKARAVARLLPPESAPIPRISQEIGVSVATLERWMSDALSRPAERAWTAAAHLEAVIATAAAACEVGGIDHAHCSVGRPTRVCATGVRSYERAVLYRLMR